MDELGAVKLALTLLGGRNPKVVKLGNLAQVCALIHNGRGDVLRVALCSYH